MYKFIIGNVRISVIDDSISHDQAINAARQAILTANSENKLLSHIELNASDDGIEVNTTEKQGTKLLRKSLKQSLLDGMLNAVQEKLLPSDTYSAKDTWYDSDTGQEWHGGVVSEAKEEILKSFEEWSAATK
ncbi:hypothetical protein [Anaerosinus massiliensis]|uniref:hypothetical protein n=1 Tax=Massilibacillus massiliensis TaxID=1806837 RepID=UPI000DA612DC|nr:hypothetical protein [Massilibacillus massiliensis]